MRIGGDDTIETYALGNLPGQTLEDNFWLDTYRDELGINVVYDWIVKGDDEYSQKINITIATGELPDIMSVTATQMVQLAEADLIADISDVYEAYAADFTKETLTQEGDDPFLGIWRGNPRPFNDRDESTACFYHTIKLSSAEKYRKDSDGSLQRKQYCMYNIHFNYLLTICILYDIIYMKNIT